MSPLVLFIVLVGHAVILWAVWQFGGARSVSVKPPQLNFADRSGSVTSADAAAAGAAETATGACEGSASVDGFGGGTAVAALGHEFQYTGSRRRTFKVYTHFTYRTHLEITDEPAHVGASVDVVHGVVRDSFATDTRITLGQEDNPQGGGSTSEVHEFEITLDPNGSFKVAVEVMAFAKSIDATDAAGCKAKVVVQVTEILIVPV